MAAWRLGWSKMALATTNQSMPALAAWAMVSGLMPPSISNRWLGLQAFFNGFGFGEDLGHEFLAGEAGDYAHDEDVIDLLDGGENVFDGRRGV